MADLTQIAASLATPTLSSALQQAPDLPLGQAIEAKITQILSDGLIRLTSSFGTFELKASHPALQPGLSVRLDISQSGHVTLTVLPQRPGTLPPAPQSAQPPAQVAEENPAVITTLSGRQTAPRPAAPVTYSAAGQVVQQTQPAPTAQPAQATEITSQTPFISPSPGINTATPPQSGPSLSVSPFSSQKTQPQAAPLPVLPAILGEALAKQNSIAPLLANLDALTKLAKPLPQSLQAAIEGVLQSFPLSQGVTPQTAEQAVKHSGVFFENKLAQTFIDDPSATLAMPQSDLKAALLKLEAVLNALMPEEAPAPKPQAEENLRPPPPHGTDAPEAQRPRVPTLSIQSTQPEIVDTLGRQTESALARVRVLQFASLPVNAPGIDPQARPGQVWHLDMALLINGQAAVIPLQIEREAEKRSEAGELVRRWRVRFALDLAGLGAVHALLALGSGMIDVTLWAEREQTYALFKNMAKELHYALIDEDLDVAEIEFRAGHPRETAKRAGSTLDTRT